MKKTVDILLRQMFCIFSFPKNVVSVHDPQFASQLWKPFRHDLGVTANLTLRYHPQVDREAKRVNKDLGAV